MQNYSGVSQIPSIPPKLEGTHAVSHLSEKELNKLWAAARDLEATFSSYMFKDLKLGADDASGKESFAASSYSDMFKRSLAEQLSRSGSLGVAKQIYQDSAKLADKAAGLPNTPTTLAPTTLRFKSPTNA